MTFNNDTYKVLKWIALIGLPALSTLVMALGDIWGIPYKQQISLTINAVNAFIGVLIGVSSASYKGEGVLEVMPSSNEFAIVFNDEDTLEKAKQSKRIVLSVATVDDSNG